MMDYPEENNFSIGKTSHSWRNILIDSKLRGNKRREIFHKSEEQPNENIRNFATDFLKL